MAHENQYVHMATAFSCSCYNILGVFTGYTQCADNSYLSS